MDHALAKALSSPAFEADALGSQDGKICRVRERMAYLKKMLPLVAFCITYSLYKEQRDSFFPSAQFSLRAPYHQAPVST